MPCWTLANGIVFLLNFAHFLTYKIILLRPSYVLNYSSKPFYINVHIGYLQYMAQALPLIRVLHGLNRTQIFIRSCANLLVPRNADILYLQKKEIEVV